MNPPGSHTAIVLAAQRRGQIDPLAQAAGGGHKCLIDIHGRPMIAWVLDALLECPRIARVIVSIEDADVLDRIPSRPPDPPTGPEHSPARQPATVRLADLPEFADAFASGRLTIETSGDTLFASVVAAVGGIQAPHCPALITTADNPLLTRAALDHFLDALASRPIDAAIAMTRASVMRSKYPDGQRRFYRFKDDHYSNCNLYALATPKAVQAARIFEGGGQFGKKAIRMLRAFGAINFLLYRLGVLRLSDCAARLSRGFGVRVGFVDMPFAESPIDVDNERTLGIARDILADRPRSAGGSH